MEKPLMTSLERQDAEGPKLVQVLRGLITLNEDISAINFYSAWFQLVICAFMFSSVDLLQTIMLQDNFEIASEEIGAVISEIQVIDYTSKFISALAFGYLVDKFGRKVLYYYSIFSVSVGYMFLPLQTNIFPDYMLVKIFVSQGVIALSMLPLTADYVHDSTKGRAVSLNYTMGFVGAFICALFYVILIAAGASLTHIYWTYGIFIFVLGNILGFGVKGGTEYYKQQLKKQHIMQEQVTTSWTDLYKTFMKVPWLRVILLISVLGNADQYVMSSGVPLLIKSMIPDQESANIQIGIYLVIFFALSIGALLYYGRLMDKLPHFRLLMPLMMVATLGFCLIPLAGSGYSIFLYLFMIVEGLALPGVFSFGTFLTTLYSPAVQRGMISGVATGVGALGAMFMFVVGGYLHDNWRVDAPFIIYLGLITLSTLLCLKIANNMKKDSEKTVVFDTLLKESYGTEIGPIFNTTSDYL